LYEPGIYSGPFTTSSAKMKYLDLMSHKNKSVSEYAIRLVKKIGKKEGNKDYVFDLLQIIDFNNNTLTNLYAMRAINEILYKVKYDNRITDVYLKALELSNANYRVAALKGLRYANDEKLKQSLSYLKDDPSKQVQKVFTDFDTPPNKSWSNKFRSHLSSFFKKPY